MKGRELKVLVAPGVPFQHRALATALDQARMQATLRVFDCASPMEAFDSLAIFQPDCIVLDESCEGISPAQIASLCRRLQEPSIRGGLAEAAPVYLMASSGLMAKGLPMVQALAKADVEPASLCKLLLESARPYPAKGIASIDFRLTSDTFSDWDSQKPHYEWMGKPTLHQESVEQLFGEERFRRLVNLSMDLTCVVEPDGFIKYASASARQILGVEPEELAGRFLQELLPKCRRSNIARFFSPGPSQKPYREIRMTHISGQGVYLEVACTDLTADPVVKGFVVSARDVTPRRLAEQKLNYQAHLLAGIREAIIGLDAEQHITYLNAAAERLYKTTLAEALGQSWQSLFQIEWLHDDEQTYMEEALAERGVWQGEVIQHTSSGRRIYAELSVSIQKEAENQRPGRLIVVRDIKDRKVVETVLHESESRFRSLVTVTSDLVWHTGENDLFTFISPHVSRLLGYEPAQLLGHNFTEFAEQGKELQKLIKAIKTRQAFSYLQVTCNTLEGQQRWLEVSGLPNYATDQKYCGFQGVVRDITERVEADRILRQNLKEKEILIKEIHHRVKNNMQIVSSLLFLQTQFIRDPEMLSRLQESQDRIRSMALVHEKLYQSSDLSRIDFSDYVETLARHISNSYRTRHVHLSCDLGESPVSVGIDTAIPCGLILNELLSNAYKHAFPDERSGHVEVVLTTEGRFGKLTVIDNGIGIASTDLRTYEETSLGSQLVLELVKQLQGCIEVSRLEMGTQFGLHFPLG